MSLVPLASAARSDETHLDNKAARAAGLREIAARAIKFPFAADTPRYWFDGDPFLTHVMNALSLTFPEGERMFIHAVRDLRHHVKDPLLQRQVQGFLAQESLHRREHDSFNDWLRSQGIDVDKYYREIKDNLSVDEPRGSKRWRLAVTCALEHFTAMLAEEWLTRDDLRACAHENVRPLWTWHALEELDHKAVAFDVYQAANGSYRMRIGSMLAVTFGFVVTTSFLHARLMATDKQLFNVKSWLSGSYRCWGPRGYFTSLLPSYVRYFKRDFHPWDVDHSALIERFAQELAHYQRAA